MGILDGSTKRTIVSCEDSALQSYEEISPNAVNSSKNSDLFLGRVRGGSDCVAIITTAGRSYTYKEIDLLSDQVAFSLIKQGIKPQSFVLILLPSSVDFVVGILGILKAGCIYVPVDINSSQERIRFILEDTMAEALITTSDLKELYLGFSNHVLCFEDLTHGEQEALPSLIKPDDLACVVYSLGITSQTKGIAVTHRSLVNSVYARHLHLSPPVKKIALLHSIGLDIATTTIFWALSEGASLVIPQDSNIGDVESVLYLIKTQEITHLLYSPSLYRSLLKQAKEEDLRSLEVVSLKGERWHPDLVAQHQQICPQANLYNEYGLTETTTWSSIAQIYDRETNALQEVTIGRPIANTQMYLLNDRQQLVPVGVKGEIYIGGVSLADRYLNQPDLTNSCFIKHPYKEGERLYRTGDTGCYREDGRIEYIGRIDRQIKVLGHQIESEQIEHVLYQYPKVEEAVVLLRKAYSEQEQLVGYVQLKDDKSANPQEIGKELERALAKQLPTYMIPQVWVFVETFKVTPAGKIDRETLPEPSYDRNSQYDVEEPHTEIEEQLIAIWCELLQLDQVSVKDNFFEVGGDSILSIQLVSKARQAGLEINMEQVFESPTIEELAQLARVSSKKTATDFKEVVEERHVPLSPIQQWFLEQKENDVHHYNQALLLECFEGLDKECLERGLQSLLQTHSSLRLRFEQEETGEWKQRYEAYETLAEYHKGICRVEYLEDLPQEAAKARRLEIIEEVQQSLDITKGPLFQGVLFKGDSKGDSLFLVAHHLVVDSVSWRILIEDLESAYRQAVEKKEEIILEPEPRSYGWWSQELLTLAQQETWKQEIEYWEKVLESPQSQLPRELSDGGSNTVENMGEITVELSEEETRQLLQEVPRAYRTQINDILLTALGYAIKEWTGSGRLSLMLEGHGREQLTEDMDLSRTVGWFTSIYPINIDLEGAEDLGIGIKRVKEYLRNIPKKGVGYGMLRYLTQEGHEKLDKNKEPELSFNYLGQLDATIQQKSLFSFAEGSIGNCIALKNQRPRLLEINCQVMNGRLGIHVGYTPSYHQKATIQALGESFIQQLKEVIVHCCKQKHFGYTPSDFPLAKLTQEQLDQVFGDTPAIEDIYPLSPMQEGLLFQKLFQPDSEAYFIQTAFIIEGSLDIEKFKKAWETLVRKFSILRTGFKWIGLEQPLQFALGSVVPKISIEDWQNVAQPSIELSKYIKKLIIQDYDFTDPPLIQVHLLKLADEKYYMVWNFHHIILDGWCTSILINELISAYVNIKSGQEASTKPTKPYKDYIAWLYKQDIAYGEEFWKQHLLDSKKTILSLTPFTNDTTNEKYGMLAQSLSTDIVSQLIVTAKKYKVTLSDICQLAWGYLLSRYTQEDDVIFGITVSGRAISLNGIENMLGLFINTLPQRIKIRKTDELQTALQNVHNQLVQMQRYAYIPLAKIQSMADDYDGLNIFNTLFLFESLNIKPEVNTDSGIKIEGIVTNEQVEYPLTLLVQAEDEQATVNFYYDTKHFQELHIKQLARHYIHILTEIAMRKNPELGSIELFNDSEKQDLLDRWRGEKVSLSEMPHFFDHFDQNVKCSPGKIAVIDGKQSLSYEELYSLSNKVSAFLSRLGVGSDTPVCIYFDRSNEYLVSLLGTWRARAIYVPLDPRIPVLRIQNIIKKLEDAVIITDKRYRSSLEGLNLKHLYCIEDILKEDGKNIDNWENPDFSQVAYIIYTSGSTGDPKGVMVEHLAMHNHLESKISILKLSQEDTVAQTASQSFDVSVWQFIAPLMVGAKVIIIEDDAVSDPEQLSERVFKHQITVMGTVPSLLAILLDGIECNPELQMKLQSLEWVMPSGEALSVNLYKRWSNLYPNVKVINAYGPTECGDDVTHHIIMSTDGISNTIPINGTIQNMNIYVVDEDIRPVPYGTIGELYVSGVSLARGYYSLPEQTKAVFLENPFEDGKKIYRTGDSVTTRPDGTILFIGRNDNQIKINGCRIEIGEIESVLLQYPRIKEVCVHLDKHEGIPRLTAYFIPKDETVTVDEIREFVSDKLIDYMQPKYFVSLDKFPLTTSGKTDRKRLPRPQNDFDNKEIVSPKDEVELKIYKIWQDILKIEKISTFDSFMNLGGHSLLVVRMALQVRKIFNANIPINEISGKLTLAELAQKIKSCLPTKNTALITIQTSEKNQPLFIIHPISGLAYPYTGLSNYIKDCPMYGINNPYFGQQGQRYQSLQEMASKYLEIMIAMQPEGPYRLAGWSFGGLVALEMAGQLTRALKRVEDVILIDTYHPKIVRTDNPDEAARAILHQDGISIDSIEGQYFFEEMKNNEKLMYNYSPIPYGGRTTLLKSQSPEPIPNAGWTNEILPHLYVHHIAGTHYEMFHYPIIKIVADKIRDILNIKE